MMIVSINRTGRGIGMMPKKNPYCRSAFEIADEYGYHRLSVLDIDNFDEIDWNGIEFNRLLIKGDIVYCFVEWLGHYPYVGIVIDEIGKVIG